MSFTTYEGVIDAKTVTIREYCNQPQEEQDEGLLFDKLEEIIFLMTEAITSNPHRYLMNADLWKTRMITAIGRGTHLNRHHYIRHMKQEMVFLDREAERLARIRKAS